MRDEKKEKLARKYFSENPTPIQDLCPEIRQYWKCADGYMYWNNKTGKRTLGPEINRFHNNSLSSSSKNVHEDTYIHYVDEIDAIEVSRIWLHTPGRMPDGQKADWVFDDVRYLIFRNDNGAYSTCIPYIEDNKYYCKAVAECISGLGYTYNENGNLAKELSRFSPQYADIKWRWQFVDRYRRTWVERNKTKRTREIFSYELESPTFTHTSDITSWTYIQILDDKFAVLRVFEYDVRWDRESGDYKNIGSIKENLRIFIDNKGKPTVLTCVYGKWTPTPKNTVTNWRANSMRITNPEAIQEWAPLKYISNLLDWNSKESLEKLLQILRHPIIEQLIKAGYKNIASELMYNNEIAANLCCYFKCEKERKLQMYKLLGVNKWILEAVEKSVTDNERLRIIRNMKRLYDRFDISDLSKETVDMLIPNLCSLNYQGVGELVGKGGYRNLDNHITEEERKFILKLFRINNKNDRANLTIYYLDVRQLYDSLINPPDIDLFDVEDYEGMRRLHDSLVELRRREDADRQAAWYAHHAHEREKQEKKFAKLQEERIAKYEADGDKFCIRVPHNLEEITVEGHTLHHCVGSYVNSHANGRTNIIFLRRKDAENVPFYTIEVCNDSVIQIHGNHNRWLGNDPEAIPFVYQWLTERGIKFDKKMLLNTGSGYGAGHVNLPDSYLTQIA